MILASIGIYTYFANELIVGFHIDTLVQCTAFHQIQQQIPFGKQSGVHLLHESVLSVDNVCAWCNCVAHRIVHADREGCVVIRLHHGIDHRCGQLLHWILLIRLRPNLLLLRDGLLHGKWSLNDLWSLRQILLVDWLKQDVCKCGHSFVDHITRRWVKNAMMEAFLLLLALSRLGHCFALTRIHLTNVAWRCQLIGLVCRRVCGTRSGCMRAFHVSFFLITFFIFALNATYSHQSQIDFLLVFTMQMKWTLLLVSFSLGGWFVYTILY